MKSDFNSPKGSDKMKKTIVVILAVFSAMAIFFTGCGKKDNAMNDNTTTTRVTTTAQSTTKTTTEADSRNDNAGAPESTSQRSAAGDIVEGAADGIGDVADGIGDAAEDLGDAVNRAADDAVNNRNARNAQWTH